VVNQFSSPLKNLTEQFDKLIGGRLWLKVIIALALGVLLGILLGPDSVNLYNHINRASRD
jgi:ElaB/YqjD/DUF883 family membrane-anchored ribosome-binding protein